MSMGQLITERPLLMILTMLFYLMLILVTCFRGIRSKILSLLISNNATHVAPQIVALDSVRGLAAIAVATAHTWGWLYPETSPLLDRFPNVNRLGEAVAIFCVLSGFVVYRSLAYTGLAYSSDLAWYLKRRFFRIYPLFFVTTVFSFLFIATLPTDYFQTFFSELFLFRLGGHPSITNPPSWSIHVEIMFYLLIPLYFVVTRTHSLLWALLAVFSSSFVGFPGPLTRELMLIKYFALGILLVEVLPLTERVTFLSKWYTLAVCLGISLALFWSDLLSVFFNQFTALCRIQLTLRGDLGYSLSTGLAAFLLLFVILKWKPLQIIIGFLPLRILGVVSYSIYLTHPLLLVAGTPIRFNGMADILNSPLTSPRIVTNWITFLFVYLPSIVTLATLSYLTIERPFLLLGRRKVVGLDCPPNPV